MCFCWTIWFWLENRFLYFLIYLFVFLLGKSTCINLLERFYDPTNGQILIDGRDIHEYNHQYLHKKIAMVGQEPILFNRTIREILVML